MNCSQHQSLVLLTVFKFGIKWYKQKQSKKHKERIISTIFKWFTNNVLANPHVGRETDVVLRRQNTNFLLGMQ